MIEAWLPIPGFVGLYEVSALGRIRSLDRISSSRNRWGEIKRRFPGKLLRVHTPKDGYPQVTLMRRGERVQVSVHSAVASAFLGPCPEGKLVRHLDDDRQNNAVSNLCYGTGAQNWQDCKRNGRAPLGEKHHASKLTDGEVREILRLWPSHTQRELGVRFGVVPSTIGHIVHGRWWKHIGDGPSQQPT